MTNGLSHTYQLDKSTLISRGKRSNFLFLFHFSCSPDGTPRLAVSHLRLFFLPMSHKKDARLIWVKNCSKYFEDFT